MEYISAKRDLEAFRKAKKAFYGRLLDIFHLNGRRGEDLVIRGFVCANCSHHLEDFPMPFGCKHLEVCTTPMQIENGKEGIFICERSGHSCELCEETFEGVIPQYCVLFRKDQPGI